MINIKEIKDEITKFKQSHHIIDDSFEMFALNEIIKLPLFENLSKYSLYRDAEKKNGNGFVLQKNSRIEGITYNKEREMFITSPSLSQYGSKGSPVLSNEEKSLIKTVVDLFDSANYDEFKEKFNQGYYSKYSLEKDDSIVTELSNKNYNFQCLSLLVSLSDLNSSNIDPQGYDQLELSKKILDDIRKTLHMIDKFGHMNKIPEILAHETVEDRLMSSNYQRLLSENFYDNNTDNDFSIINTLLENDNFANGTLTGIALTAKNCTEIIDKTLGIYFEALKEHFLGKFELLDMLKSKEELCEKFLLDKFIENIKKEYPVVNQNPNDNLIIKTEVGEFVDNFEDAANSFKIYLNEIDKVGLTSANRSIFRNEDNIEMFYEKHAENRKRVSFQCDSMIEKVYDYTFQEINHHGLNILVPRNVYNSKNQSKESLENSINHLLEYANNKNCLIMPTDDYDHASDLLIAAQEYIEKYKNMNTVLIFKNYSHREENIFNACLALKTKYKDSISFDDIKQFNDTARHKENAYIDVETIKENFDKMMSERKKKAVIKNGPY